MSSLIMGPDLAFQTVDLQVNQTDLLAHTDQYLVAPGDGYWDGLDVITQTAVTTGGTIQAANVGQATIGNDKQIIAPGNTTPANVAGAVATVINASAVGTVVSVKATAGDPSQPVKKGQALKLVLAGFATAGAVQVTARFRSEPLDTLLPLSG